MAEQVEAAYDITKLTKEQRGIYENIDHLNQAINEGSEQSLTLNSKQVNIVQNREAALKAMAGMQIKLVKDITKAEKEQKKQLATLKAQLEVLKAQEALRVAQRGIAEEKATQEKINKLADAESTIRKATLDITKELAAQAEKRFKAEQKLIKEQQRGLALQREAAASRARTTGIGQLTGLDSQIAQAQRAIAEQNQFGNLFTRGQKKDAQQALIDLEFQQQMKVIQLKEDQARREKDEELRIIKQKEDALTRELAFNAKQISDKQMIALREEELLRNQQELDRVKQQQTIDNLTAEKKALDLEDALVAKQTALQKIRDEQASAEARARIEAFDFQADIINAFVASVGDTKFTAAIAAFVGATRAKQIRDASTPQQIAKRTDALLAGQDRIDELRGSIRDKTAGTQTADIESRRAILKTQLETEQKIFDLMLERQELELRLQELKANGNIEELENTRKLLEEKKKNIAFERENSKASFEEKLAGFNQERNAARENHKSKTDALNNEHDIIRNLGNTISGNVSSAFNGFFQSVRQGKGIMESAKDSFNSLMQTIIGSMQESITDSLIKPAVSGFFGSLFPGSAAGGLVHLAGGGAMRRDRVPAMLEPGEFVIRKPMAKAIGGPALHGMNSTGRGLTPNIEVVVNNQGTPKDAEANVKPQIDIDKMVVEIVTRDVRNNGPIRKTLRGE